MSGGFALRAAILTGALVSALCVVTGRQPQHTPLPRPLAELPLDLGSWRGADAGSLDAEVTAVLRADEYLNRVYSDDHVAVGLYVAYYGSQAQGDSIHSPKHCLPGSGWQPISQTRSVVRAGDRELPLNRYVIQRRGERQLVLYWFQGRGRLIASEYANKLFLFADALRLGRTHGALVRVVTPLGPDDRTADQAATRFIHVLQPALGRWL